MKYFSIGILSALGLAGAMSLSAASLARADTNACVPPNAAMMHAEFSTSRAGGNAIRISGDQAERFLYYLNDKVGRDTDTWGEGVIVERFPALGFDTVAVIDDGCVDESKLITLDPQTTAMAFEASENPNF
jgi:hypothetical protein